VFVGCPAAAHMLRAAAGYPGVFLGDPAAAHMLRAAAGCPGVFLEKATSLDSVLRGSGACQVGQAL
jgi:hypothetical protein